MYRNFNKRYFSIYKGLTGGQIIEKKLLEKTRDLDILYVHLYASI